MSDDKKSHSHGVQTAVWGPPAWIFLHSVAAGYPTEIISDDDKQKRKCIKKFFKCLGDTFPCKYCRDSYREYYKKHNINEFLDSRIKLNKWLYNMHNEVNYKLGVKLCDIPSFEEVFDKYQGYLAKCTKSSESERTIKENGCIKPENGLKKKCIVKITDSAGNIIHDCNIKPKIGHDILLKFYRNEVPITINEKSLKFSDLVNDKMSSLTENMEFIFVLFPLYDSPENLYTLPSLDDVIVKSFKEDKKIQENFEKAVRNICNILGYNISYNFENKINYWKSNYNFDFSIKSRICQSIKLLNTNDKLENTCSEILEMC